MFWNKYPYTDFHELNLDWILARMMELHKEWDEFTAINKITFSGAWNIANNYPAWAVVTINNGSECYLSTRPVPAGININNIDYWERIEYMNLIPKRYIIISDSYGNYTNAGGLNFIEQAYANRGITNSFDFHLGSAGFGRGGALNFLSVLQSNESAIDDKNTITDIIVAGGANDQIDALMSDIETGISAFISYCRAEYPNAQVYIGHFTNSVEPDLVKNLRDSVEIYKKAVNYGGHYIDNSQYIMLKLDFFRADNVHPTTDGVDALSRYLTAYLQGDGIDVIESATGTLESGVSCTLNTDKLTQIQHNGNITFHFDGGSLGSFIPASTISVLAGETTLDNFAKFKGGFCFSSDTINITFWGLFYKGSWNVPALVYVRKIGANKDVKLGMLIYSNEATSVSGTFSFLTGSTSFSMF